LKLKREIKLNLLLEGSN